MKLYPCKTAKFVAAAAVFASLALAASLGRSRQMVSIAREDTNMRAGPGTRFEALWRLIRGVSLRVTGRSGRWFKVRDFEGDEGWVFHPRPCLGVVTSTTEDAAAVHGLTPWPASVHDRLAESG